jgi:uncharacterized protein (TIGR04551 family)
MSSNALLAALLVASATAAAQSPETQTETPASAPATPAEGADSTEERIRQEVDKRMEAARQEMREEIRAQLATQSLASDWQEEWVEEKRKLELFSLDGYYRLRPNLFYQFNLGRAPGRELYLAPTRATEKTLSGADMRLRLEPTFNISEEVRVKVQLDALSNVLLGSTPMSSNPGDSAFYLFDLFNDGQTPPRSGVNALRDSLMVREVYGEVSTPVGLLRFGRMNAHWGLGILRNDGSCLDCDYGDQVDRVMFVTEPLEGFYVTPMFEFNSEGLFTTYRNGQEGQPVDPTSADDSHSWVLAVARRDTPQQVKAKLDNNQGVLNYGLHFSWRSQRYSAARDLRGNLTGELVRRDANLYIPDVWLRYEEKNFRLELEVAAYLGTIGNRSGTPQAPTAPTSDNPGDPNQNQSLEVRSFGGAAVGEYRLLDGKLNLQLELGLASGDRAPGWGAQSGRLGSDNGFTRRGDLDGPQFRCGSAGCADGFIRNFTFNRAYRVDNILWRELVGTVTDAFYAKPTVRYTLAPGFDAFGSVIYSQALYAESTPSFSDTALGLETNLGARYETDDGFIARVEWSVLFPLAGLQDSEATLRPTELATAQSVRGVLGIRF